MMTGETYMAFQRGSVILIPFPFSDLTTTKTRPAVVVSSNIYQTTRSELLLAYISSQITNATPHIDYILHDWQSAGLLKPSFVRPKVATIDPALVVHHVGKLSIEDLNQTDRRLQLAMGLIQTGLADVINQVDFAKQSPQLVQTFAEKSITALLNFSGSENTHVDIAKIRELLDS